MKNLRILYGIAPFLHDFPQIIAIIMVFILSLSLANGKITPPLEYQRQNDQKPTDMYTRSILITSAILMATISVTAKSQIESVSDLVTFSKKDFADTIKIKMMHGQVVVPVEIEGSTKYLLFDTGSPIGLWFGEEEEWMKPIDTDSITFYDVNNQQNTHVMYQCKSMKLGSLVIEHYPLTVEATMRNVLCNEFDGILGFNLVGQGLSFKLDTKDSLLIVTDRKGFFAAEEKNQPAARYRLIRKSRPVVTIDLSFGYMETVFDTGAQNTWLLVPQKDLNRWLTKRPQKRKMVDEITTAIDTTINTSWGIYGWSRDTLEERILHFPSVKIGRLGINDLYVSTAHQTSRVGAALLRHASLIIDSNKKRFVFLPHNGQQQIVVSNEEVGSLSFLPAEADDTLGVLKAVVRKGSTPYKKGIRTGDYLIEANDTPITDLCSYRRMETDGKEARLKFRSPDGSEKQVTLKRTH